MSRAAPSHPPGAGLLIPDGMAAALVAEVGSDVAWATRLGGGCISPAWHVHLRDGRELFLKAAPAAASADLLESEAEALRRLAAARAIRIPAVLAEGSGWLALEWLAPGHPTPGSWHDLGRGLARLHRTQGPAFGWDRDNFIGSLPQRNGEATSWADFWARHRLLPQLQRAGSRLSRRALADFEVLLGRLPELLQPAAEEDGPSLLHGDLWSGNVLMSATGPALIDPSSYYGHREVDLAMAELFGGFPAAFGEAYAAEWPLMPGASARRPVYQLYYLLVHVNLFGGSYVAGTEAVLQAALG
jgi:protein-ribulosamine 3-kinase